MHANSACVSYTLHPNYRVKTEKLIKLVRYQNKYQRNQVFDEDTACRWMRHASIHPFKL